MNSAYRPNVNGKLSRSVFVAGLHILWWLSICTSQASLVNSNFRLCDPGDVHFVVGIQEVRMTFSMTSAVRGVSMVV
ncbi:hypothetical protein JTE90_016109 [Oedothorax gibbosus]|uniref:Secreted protein n=1 Tax=Oedothorax gibbosus TaxID=931172 RepID=A0AAV6U1V9_9ARAC|nr:hypothetical protein JTE90_016109 [Oedothorax gibbosus]